MIYFKLTIRNAKRCIVDYLLYITTMITLVTIMIVSNGIAVAANIQKGFQTASLPILITIILIVLVGYIHTFMLKQRAKEFANYLLLGMERNKLSWMFVYEFFLIGIICFVIAAVIGFGIYLVFCSTVWIQVNQIKLSLFGKSLVQTWLYFCLVESLSAFRIKHIINNLQIQELMNEKKRNQQIKDKNQYRNWGIIFILNMVCLIGLLCGIVFLSEDAASFIIPIITIPLLISIFSFYEWIFGYLYAKRQKQVITLYQNNRLYQIAQITSNFKTSAIMNSIFCICLFFSAMSFLFGILMFQPDTKLFHIHIQQWMGVLQISLCFIFLAIYFSMLSLQQIIELRQETKNIQILYNIGKSKKQIKTIIQTQLAIRLAIPMIMCFILLLLSMPLFLPITVNYILLKATIGFHICFLILYLCYFFVVITISKQHIEKVLYK